MGCDIHVWAERKSVDGYQTIKGVDFSEGSSSPFDWISYGLYGFLAGVRNYSDVPPISLPRGLPQDISGVVAGNYADWELGAHSASGLSVKELAAFDYDKPLEDRRVGRQIAPNLYSGACTAEPGEGKMTTYREFLGDAYFDDLAKLEACGADRVVFWFDN